MIRRISRASHALVRQLVEAAKTGGAVRTARLGQNRLPFRREIDAQGLDYRG